MNMMNIYAKKGHKVIVTESSARNGLCFDKEKVAMYLEIGKVYTISYIEMGNWHTTVHLQELPDVYFNSVNFEDYREQ